MLFRSVIQDTILNSYKTGYETRTGTQTKVTESFTKESVGDKLVSKELIPFMRSRNVEFNSQKLKPLTQVYAFFDGVNVTKYCTPKLLEILMSSGTFQVGETVIGSIISTGLQQLNVTENPFIKFRVALLSGLSASVDDEYAYVPTPGAPALTGITIEYKQPNQSFIYLNKENTVF